MKTITTILFKTRRFVIFYEFRKSSIDPLGLKRRVFFELGEDVFQVNLRSSSFQVRVTDTGRCLTVTKIFRDLWKPRRRARKKTENEHRTSRRQRGLRDARVMSRDVSVSLDHLISAELVVMI